MGIGRSKLPQKQMDECRPHELAHNLTERIICERFSIVIVSLLRLNITVLPRPSTIIFCWMHTLVLSNATDLSSRQWWACPECATQGAEALRSRPLHKELSVVLLGKTENLYVEGLGILPDTDIVWRFAVKVHMIRSPKIPR